MNRSALRTQRIALLAGVASLLAIGLLLLQPAGAVAVANVAPVGTSAATAATAPSVHPKTTCTSGSNPEFVAYDPVTKWFYVGNVGTHTVTVYKGTCTLAGTIALPTGSVPRGLLYDPATNRIVVADGALNQLYVISKLSIKQTVTSPMFDGPFAVVYDPQIGYYGGGGSVLVTNVYNDTITAVSESSPAGAMFAYQSVPVGSAPEGIAYDPVYGTLLVTNAISDNVTVLSASYLTVAFPSFGVGTSPLGVACSPSTLLCYVANELSDNVSIVDAYGVSSTLAVGTNPFAVAYDPATLNMWVSNSGSRNISVIGTTEKVVGTQSMPKGSTPIGMDYNYNSGKMDVALWSLSEIDSA